MRAPSAETATVSVPYVLPVPGLVGKAWNVKPSLVEYTPYFDEPGLPTIAMTLLAASTWLALPKMLAAPWAGEEVSVMWANPKMSPIALNSGTPDDAVATPP